MAETPAMRNLAGAYLNQDWAVDYATWQEAVDAFVAESPDLAPSLPTELDTVLSEPRTEEELHMFFRELGGAYRPRSEDAGYRGWLAPPRLDIDVSLTPALWEFLGGYLHQDWADEFTDEWQALDQFASDAPDLASGLAGEINRVLSEYDSEDDLHAYLAQQGANYRPLDAGGYRGWLGEIARRVAAAAD